MHLLRHSAKLSNSAIAASAAASGRNSFQFQWLRRSAAHFSSSAASSDSDSNSKKKDGDSASSFVESLGSKIQASFESNPELKKTMEELGGTDSIGKKSKEFADRIRKLDKEASKMKDTVSGHAADASEGASNTFAKFRAEAEEKAKSVPRPDINIPGMEGSEETVNKVKDAMGSIGTTFRSTHEKVLGSLPKSFAGDDKSWADAARAVFGLRPLEAKSSEAQADQGAASEGEDEVDAVWHEATDEETGKVYYYNDEGETRWDDPRKEGEEETPQMTPEEEAAAWAEAKAAAGPSLIEQQIEELASTIPVLEERREAALEESDMAAYKDLNKEIIAVRKEMEKLAAKANTDAMVTVEEKKGAWEKFGENLKDTPLLKGIFGLGKEAEKLKEGVDELGERLEHSQNPLVYKMYSMWDSVFAENEMGEAIREIRKLDPTFTMEQFQDDMEHEIVPAVLGAYLKGDAKTLDEWCGEAASAATKASIDQRNQAGRVMDPNILNMQHFTVAAAKVVDKVGPIIVMQFMAQQINCLYDKKGNVVEGNDDEIVAVFYAFVMKRVFDEEQNRIKYEVAEFAIQGTVPWI